MKTNVYIDGFNLYYGCLKDTPYRWLNLSALMVRLLPEDNINRIRYFTALVTTRPGDPPETSQKRLRQQIYLRAIKNLPRLTIHEGHYLSRTKRRPLAEPVPGLPATVVVRDTEEKGSDVNLATELLLDAFASDAEAYVLVTNDSDLLRPVEAVRERFGVPVGVLNPHQKASQVLKRVASFHRQIHTSDLRMSQFPSTITDSYGTIYKPPSW